MVSLHSIKTITKTVSDEENIEYRNQRVHCTDGLTMFEECARVWSSDKAKYKNAKSTGQCIIPVEVHRNRVLREM